MKKVLKYVGIVLGVLLLIPIAGIGFVRLAKPSKRPAPDVQVPRTAEAVARGHYLFDHVAACAECHSPRDFSRYGAPPDLARVGSGMCFPDGLDMPGKVCAGNLTSDPAHGLGKWTDGEILRAVREGVARDGRPLFMMMPYGEYHAMGDADAEAVVAYLRTLAPSNNAPGETRLAFPLSLIVRMAPEPLSGPVSAPSPSDHLAYGKYLTTLASCHTCHTPDGKEGMDFAGGNEFMGPGGPEVSANLTPDPTTGIGKLTKDQFISLFRAWKTLPPGGKPGRAVMPWIAFSGMSDDDLGAIFDYLRTVKPIQVTAAVAKN